MRLRMKFNLIMLAAIGAGFLIGAGVLFRVAGDSARDQIVQNSRIMMTEANAIRSYTTNALAPLLPKEHSGRFTRETVPAFAAQANFKYVQDSYPGYSYREAALNPTNLVDRAFDWEADIIRAFRDDADVKEIIIERDTPTGPLLVLSRPIRVRTEACLTCHGLAENAPPALTRTYGAVSGFGWKLDETIGAQILSVPMAFPLKLARSAYMTSLVVVALILLVIILVANLLVHFLVVRPVKRVSAAADAISLGDEAVEPYIKPGKDEISSLSVSFNRMHESLRHAMEAMR
jgi:HAMP domain-containing protein